MWNGRDTQSRRGNRFNWILKRFPLETGLAIFQTAFYISDFRPIVFRSIKNQRKWPRVSLNASFNGGEGQCSAVETFKNRRKTIIEEEVVQELLRLRFFQTRVWKEFVWVKKVLGRNWNFKSCSKTFLLGINVFWKDYITCKKMSITSREWFDLSRGNFRKWGGETDRFVVHDNKEMIRNERNSLALLKFNRVGCSKVCVIYVYFSLLKLATILFFFYATSKP